MTLSLRCALLTASVVVALSIASGAQGRELGNFDINSVRTKVAGVTQSQQTPAQSRSDAIGRATFTWVQQDLPAIAKAAAHDPEAAARAHLAQLLAGAKHSVDAAETLSDARVDRQRGGATLVRLQPRLDGIAIFHEEIALLMDPGQRLIAMRGPLPRNSADSAKSLPLFTLDAKQAVAAALGAYEFGPEVATKLSRSAVNGEYQSFRLAPAVQSKSGAVGHDEQRAKPVYFRTRSGLQPAWYVETQIADAPGKSVDGYAHVISAVDGNVLFRMNQSAHAAAYTYRVWAEDGPAFLPFPSPEGRANTPDPDGLPTDNAAPLVEPQLRTLANAPFSRAATDGWLPSGATVTSGNNANAYADLTAPSGFGAGDLQPTLTSAGTFDYAFNTALPPAANATQTQAATVHLFYTVNWLHDWFYDHGFAEADGNAQLDNYGRGGLAGDAMRVEAQDYNIQDNAVMGTPADGASPRMQTGLRTGTPVTDFTIDTSTVAHEWGHYLSNRLVGDASGLFTDHGGGLGEGWSDFVALLLVVKEEDRLKPTNAAFAGAYGEGYTGHSFYGLRRYPYSTDPAKNPISLRHIAQFSVLPTQPLPRFGFSGDNNMEEHNQGEIWASALWDGYASLLNDTSRLSFAEAQRRMKDYLVGGLKLTPVAPTMIEARDAILATVLANGANEDFALLTAAFAKRGLGAGALIPDRYSTTMAGTVESTALGGDIAGASASLGVPSGCDADPVLDIGESAMLTLAVANAGFTALASASATLSSSHPALTFPAGNTVALGPVPLFGTRSVTVPVELTSSVAPNTPITITITPDAPGIVSPPGVATSTTTFVNFDETARATAIEAFDGASTAWQNVRAPVGEGSAAWSNRSEGSTKFLHGDDGNAVAVTWIQSPTMSVSAAPLTVTLKHRHSFEAGDNDAAPFYDGGVIQTSIDGGATWTDVDLGTAGAALSDCCSNPLAGRLAFVAQSAGYPAFTDHVFTLGTAFANQANFRLRFGVATDPNTVRGGWDIDTVTVSGLNDTPFSAVVAQAPNCSANNFKSLQGAMSGTYYSTSRSGEGVLVDFGQVAGTPVVFFSWYTYEQGEQQWLVGSSTFAGADTSVAVEVIDTRGTGFGSQFRPQDVVSSPWGSVALSFPNCDTLVLTYQKLGGEAGTLTMNRGLARLETGQCNVLHGGLSGTYYSQTRSGEGVLVDFGRVGSTLVEFFTWYTYEGGEQQWLVGSQPFAPTDSTIGVDVIETSGAGFGNAFRSQDVVTTPWGRVTQRFTNCDTLELTYAKTGGESGTLVLRRGLERLGDGQCR